MSSCYSVLHPNYRGAKKYSVLVSTRFVVQADFTDYKGVKLLNRDGFLRYKDKFNKLMVQLDGVENLLDVKESTYSVLNKNYNIGVIDVLLAFDIFANNENEAAEKMRRTLEGDIAISNFTLIDADTSKMDFDCEVLSYQFDESYLIKEITHYDEAPKKYEQLASIKVIVKGDIPEVPNCIGEWGVPYKSDDLSNDYIYKFEGFNLTINGLKNIDYRLIPVSFKVLEKGLAEFTFAFNFKIYGYSSNHASDVFEEYFSPSNIRISDFIFMDDEHFITTELEVVKIAESSVEELAVEI